MNLRMAAGSWKLGFMVDVNVRQDVATSHEPMSAR